jgi:hypothetical protein
MYLLRSLQLLGLPFEAFFFFGGALLFVVILALFSS